MIKHIVCFKLADPAPANCQKAAEVLRSMDGNVPLLRGIEVGVDELRSGRSYDVILQVLLDDMAALDAYQQDRTTAAWSRNTCTPWQKTALPWITRWNKNKIAAPADSHYGTICHFFAFFYRGNRQKTSAIFAALPKICRCPRLALTRPLQNDKMNVSV